VKVRYTRQALLDLGEIYDYIAAENAAAASRVVTEIEHEIQQLKAHPRLGRPGRVDETRELVISRFPYVVAYRDQADEIQILSVMHAARAWPESF
jgi:addiction module RelE/StbE family toxin